MAAPRPKARRPVATAVVLAETLAGASGLPSLAGCAELDDHRRFEDQVGALEIVQTIPAADAVSVDPLAQIDLCLSAEVDPRVIGDFDATLHSGELTFDAQYEVQLISWRAPGSRDQLADARWCPGSVISLTPSSPLQPGLLFRVQLREIAGLGWAGEALDTQQEGWAPDEDGERRRFFEFRVAGSPGDPEPEEVPPLGPGPTLTELFEPGRVFDPQRAACGCHQGNPDSGTPDDVALAQARLDLGDPETAWSELVLRPGLQPTDFPMISPRRPSDSYLLQKLVRTADGEALHAIHGVAMPPDAPLPHADIVDVAYWIADGAKI